MIFVELLGIVVGDTVVTDIGEVAEVTHIYKGGGFRINIIAKGNYVIGKLI